MIAAALALLPGAALAHHGQDFLLVESPTVPHPGSVYLLANGAFALDGQGEESAMFSPALLVGASQRVAFELHAHAVKLRDGGWTYEATAPSLHLLLSDPADEAGLRIGLSLEYEVAREAEAADNTELRLSFEQETGRGKWGANLIASREQGGNAEAGAALGYRRTVSDRAALGLELESSFGHAEGATLLAGAYLEPNEACTLKFGLGGERGDDGDFHPLAQVGLVLALH